MKIVELRPAYNKYIYFDETKYRPAKKICKTNLGRKLKKNENLYLKKKGKH